MRPAWRGMRGTLLVAVCGAAAVALFATTTRSASPGDPRPLEYVDTTGLNLLDIIEGDRPLEDYAPDALPVPRRAAAAGEPIPAPAGLAADFAHYTRPSEIVQALAELEQRYPELVEAFEVGTSWQGRPIRGIRLANEASPQPIEDRPAMYIDGQHHARELISNQIPLYTAWRLLDGYGRDPLATHLLDSRVVYVVPSVSPDGNAIALADYQAIRKTANPTGSDDDGDGLFDEDPSAGYGYSTHSLRRFVFDQDWADQHPSDPLAPGWRDHLLEPPSDLGRYTGALGGPMVPISRRDLDGDGEPDDDEVGGVDPNRNYDAHWDQGDPDPPSDAFRGPSVWSEPEARAVRDATAQIATLATALSYHSGTDVILHPWGWSPTAGLPEAGLFELLARKGSQLTEVNGFAGSPHTWTARGLYAASGSTMDYLYESRGVLAFSPEVYGGGSVTTIQRLGATGTFTVGQSTGAGFNPPPGEILASVDRWNRFATYLLAATPNVEVYAVDGSGGRLGVTIGNDGAVPVVVAPRLSAGGQSTDLETRMLSAGTSLWTVALPDASQFELRIEASLPSIAPHVIERLSVALRRTADGVEVVGGPLPQFVDLSTSFPDGWWAGAEWDVPGRYHIGPDIPATPPATGELPPTPTPSPTPTDERPHRAFAPRVYRP